MPNEGKMTMSRKAARSKDDNVKQNQALDWIGAVVKANIKGDFKGSLGDGVLLCKLANAIQKGSVKKFAQAPKKAFAKVDNVQQFVVAAKKIGVKTNLFTPTDLTEGKNLHNVVSCIFELAELAKALGVRPTLSGKAAPAKAAAASGGAAPAAATGNVINITEPVVERAKPEAYKVDFAKLDEEAIKGRMVKVFDALVSVHFLKGVERMQAGGKYTVGAGHGQKTMKSKAFKFIESLGFEIYSLQGGAGGHLIKATPSLRQHLPKVLSLYAAARSIHLK